MQARRSLIIGVTALALSLAPTALAAPANDNFAAAEALSDRHGTIDGTNIDATKEPGEPAHAGNAGGRSVWYMWTAPTDGTYVFATFGSLDTLLAVYTGSDVAALVEVASNDDATPLDWRSQVVFQAAAGTSYAVAVDGFGAKIGHFDLTWRLTPANDLFAHPQVVTGQVGKATGTNVGATMEAGEPAPSTLSRSVWFEWTAPSSGTVKFSTLGARFDTVLAVYTGASVDALTMIASNDDDPEFRCCASSFAGFEAVAGTVYRIAVGGWSGRQGRFVLSWSRLISGTPASETLVGTPGVEEIRGLGGNDVLRGLGGADVVVGGPGHDRGFGGSGNDVLLDRRGVDTLVGGGGADSLNAADGAAGDLLDGGPGRDACVGNKTDIRRRCP